MLLNEIKITADIIPEGWSLESADFVNKLLKRRAVDRLGCRGVQELKNHPWFSNVDWKKIYHKELDAPFIPNKGDNFDVNSANKKEPEIKNAQMILDLVNKHKEFAGYYYDPNENRSKNGTALQMFINPHSDGSEITFKKTNNNTGYLILKNNNLMNSSMDMFSHGDVSSIWLNNNQHEDPFIRDRDNRDDRENGGNSNNNSVDLSNNHHFSYIEIKNPREWNDK